MPGCRSTGTVAGSLSSAGSPWTWSAATSTDRAEPAFAGAKAKGVYFGPVSYRKASEPYMTLAIAHSGQNGVTAAEVNLKLVWDVSELTPKVHPRRQPAGSRPGGSRVGDPARGSPRHNLPTGDSLRAASDANPARARSDLPKGHQGS